MGINCCEEVDLDQVNSYELSDDIAVVTVADNLVHTEVMKR